MSELKFLQKISNKKRYLIDYSNLRDNLFPFQNLKSSNKNQKNIFDKPYKGIPILFPTNLNYFEYKNKKNIVFEKSEILKKIFYTNNYNYLPYKNYISQGNKFNNNLKIKKKFIHIINEISTFNKVSIHKIKELNAKFNKTCSFQTRNIPHLGHEKIIEHLINKFDHVVVNPVIGPKKIGDVKFEILKEAYDYIIKKKFQKKVTYIPIIANMFYAGPREAIHHSNIRKKLGFKYFVIGRDHAGAFDNYKPLAAYKLVAKYEKKININIERLKGAYFCMDCRKISVNFDCKHNNYQNISGTQFRKKLETKKIFVFADKKLQKKLHNLKTKIFI